MVFICKSLLLNVFGTYAVFMTYLPHVPDLNRELLSELIIISGSCTMTFPNRISQETLAEIQAFVPESRLAPLKQVCPFRAG